jgi:predicted naringenin-chalcone synthase
MYFSLSNFQIILPKFKITQKETLNWLINAHIHSEKNVNKNEKILASEIKERFLKVACKDNNISYRGSSIDDYLHENWDKMKIYTLNDNPNGQGLEKRTKLFSEITDEVFRKFYKDSKNSPSNIIHVTCTGYASPSPAQKLVSYKNWGDKTQVTHAYHMGCYGSIPAIRIAKGLCSISKNNKETDIVHTEVCSLHTNPKLHDLAQIVAQSLFADGFIKYTLGKKPGLKILSTHQETINKTEDAMLWDVSEYGFKIHLSKKIPVLIAKNLKRFLSNMLKDTSFNLEKIIKDAIFAIHPGGPKIIKNIQDILKLDDWQIDDSIDVLKNYGNMSSATLPHIWKRILSNKSSPKNSLIVSLAFGPGLSISGCILEKELN